MVDLRVEIAGVEFPSPVLVGSSSLTRNVATIEELVRAGAGGIITKTISPDPLPGPEHHFRAARADRSIAVAADARLTVDEGVALVAEARRAVSVPIIANVIGHSDNLESWSGMCLRLQDAGAAMVELDLNCHPADGLELAVPKTLGFYDTFSIGQDPSPTARVIAGLREQLDIPVISKMTLRAPDILAVASASAEAGANVVSGVNAFNGLPALDLHSQAPLIPGFDEFAIGPICGPDLGHLGRKWTALLSKSLDMVPYISGTGISDGVQVIERLLLGAAAVAVCGALYLDGIDVLGEMTNTLVDFMRTNGYDSISEFRGSALAQLVERGRPTAHRIVPRIINPKLWESAAEDVYRRSRPQCGCITRTNGGISFVEAECTGCALPLIHAPVGAIEMAAADA